MTDGRRPRQGPVSPRVEPEIDYLARDYAGFRQLILDRLRRVMPGWREEHRADLGVALAEVLAYTADRLSYYQDAVATEAYLETARQRISVRRHARLLDYRMHEGVNARAWVTLEVEDDCVVDPGTLYFVTRLEGGLGSRTSLTEDELARVPGSAYEVFEPRADDVRVSTTGTIGLRVAHNRMARDAQDGTLAAGARRCRLQAGGLDLHPGDVLIFEDGLHPERRHPVRLTGVTPERDHVAVEWGHDDAPPFALGPECVIRGNVLLVDHGRRVRPERLGPVPGPGERGEGSPVPGLFRPTLGRPGLVFAGPSDPAGPAGAALDQDPRRALPLLELRAMPGGGPPPDVDSSEWDDVDGWSPRTDLVESGADDRHVTVEVDNDGRAHLRFGDGELGATAPIDAWFRATYRVGDPTAGNVGAEAIAHVVWRRGSGRRITVRNPLPARGGTSAESIDAVKLVAPHAWRLDLQRAVTVDDYATLAARHPRVRRAAACRRWSGSRYEILVTIETHDGRDTQTDPLVTEVEAYLRHHRRIAHTVIVRRARPVPLDIALRVAVDSGHLPGHVRSTLLDELGVGDLPDGRRGVFHPDNLALGEDLYLSRLVAAAQNVEGVENVTVVRFRRADEVRLDAHEREPVTAAAAPPAVVRIAPFEVARLDPESGLHLDVGETP